MGSDPVNGVAQLDMSEGLSTHMQTHEDGQLSISLNHPMLYLVYYIVSWQVKCTAPNCHLCNTKRNPMCLQNLQTQPGACFWLKDPWAYQSRATTQRAFNLQTHLDYSRQRHNQQSTSVPKAHVLLIITKDSKASIKIQ